MKECIVAKSAGFCFGVSRSVKMAEEMLAAEQNCYSLGELIHNDDVVRHLQSEGLTVVDGPEQIPQGASVIIRSHGVSRAEFEAVQRTGAAVYDATCPKVKRIHEIVAEASAEGRQPVIIGAADHPEVRAICGWCAAPVVVNDAAELAARIADGTIDCAKPLTVVIQTTQTQEKLLECQKIIKKQCTNAKLFDTICGATFTRQTEAAQMARTCDAMVVVGGSHSANSRHLYEICRSACANVQFIENAAQLDTSAFVHADTVGLTAGASVSAWIIKEVKQKMSDEILTQENPTETENFDEMLEASLKPIYNGEKVTGTVVAISGTEISVDIGTKYSGFIPTSEFTDDGIKVEDVLHVGDTIEASVVRVNDVEGTAMLSKKRLDAVKNWASIEEAQESGEIVEGKVTEDNKGGIVVSVKGIRVFVPASQSGLPKDAAMSELVGQTVRLKITEVNRGRKRVVGSIRAVAQKERRERAEKIWSEIEVGKHYHGVVKSLTSYGAFVDIGGIDGMVHVSELSWSRIKNPAEVVSVLEECRDKDGKLEEKKAVLKLIDAFTLSQYTAKKLFDYHLETKQDCHAEIAALEAKAEAAHKTAQASGCTLDAEYRYCRDGEAVMQTRKLTKEEIDLTVRRVSRIVKIGMFMDRYPAELSGGQQQRVAIARTLAPEPTVLFMDEPLSNLDAKLRLEMRYELQRLHVETGSTFVYVTHDQMEAMTLATQICLINNGVLQQYEAPLDVYHHPANLFVADFVGNPSINFVEVKGRQAADGTISMTMLGGVQATFHPKKPVELAAWFADRDRSEEEKAAALREKAKEKGYVEKGNKDEVFRYHIAKVDEEDDSLQDAPEITNEDLVLGIRPEFLDIADSSNLRGEIYGAMPTGMESTIKVRVGGFLLTGVIFGSSLFTIGSEVPLSVTGDQIMLFDRKSGRCITSGSLTF